MNQSGEVMARFIGDEWGDKRGCQVAARRLEQEKKTARLAGDEVDVG